MNIIDRIIHNHDSGFQIALSAIGAQHEKPKVNQWIPPKLLEGVPVKPCDLYFKAEDGKFKAACYQSLWLHRVMNYRAEIVGAPAVFTKDELLLLKEGGYKINIEQERIEL